MHENFFIVIGSITTSLYFFGTGNGLSYADILPDGTIDFGYFYKSIMPRGGNPSLAIDGNFIAVSGVIDTAVSTGTEPKGTGISYSTDKGINWTFLPQPIDETPPSGQYHKISGITRNLRKNNRKISEHIRNISGNIRNISGKIRKISGNIGKLWEYINI